MDRIFVDTWFWVAFVDHSDGGYKRSMELMKKWKNNKQLLSTSNFVLDEAFSKIRKRQGVRRMVEFRNALTGMWEVLQIERVTAQDEENVWNWLVFDWRELSYTDCTSFSIMKRLGISRVATEDEHFELAGFEIVK